MTLYVPVPRDMRIVRPVAVVAPGSHVDGCATLPGYASAQACRAHHPDCTPWKITVKEPTDD